MLTIHQTTIISHVQQSYSAIYINHHHPNHHHHHHHYQTINGHLNKSIVISPEYLDYHDDYQKSTIKINEQTENLLHYIELN